VILAALCFIGMVIFGFPNAAVVSLTVGVTALIPMVGAWIGGALSAFFILLISPFKALLFLVYIVVLQQLEGNLIYPKVVGQSIGLPGVLVLFSVIVGGNVAGVAGILVSVPLCSVIYTLLREFVYSPKPAHRTLMDLAEGKPAAQPEAEIPPQPAQAEAIPAAIPAAPAKPRAKKAKKKKK